MFGKVVCLSIFNIAVILYYVCRFDVMNSKSYADQANKLKCPLGQHWQIQEEALIAMLNLMQSMVRRAIYLFMGFSTDWPYFGVKLSCVCLLCLINE